MQLHDRIFVVTGAGSGIGRELALQLCARGAVVAGVDYQAESLATTAQLVAANQGRMSQHVVDVSDAEQIAALPGEVVALHGCVDGLINNAGIIHAHGTIENLPEAQVERVFQVNFWGAYRLIKAFIPHLRSRDCASIVNVSSMGGFMPFPNQVAYGASKAAVKLLSEGLRVELARDSAIRVAVVYPGAVVTGIADNSPDVPEEVKVKIKDMSKGRQFGVSAEKAALKIVRGIERDAKRIIVGPDSWLLDKLYRLMPNTTASLMAWVMDKTMGDELAELTGER